MGDAGWCKAGGTDRLALMAGTVGRQQRPSAPQGPASEIPHGEGDAQDEFSTMQQVFSCQCSL